MVLSKDEDIVINLRRELGIQPEIILTATKEKKLKSISEMEELNNGRNNK